ncbi:hypothetical protein C6A85_15810, partial [Mycobacterium sp. ITM-2017-0098]
MVIAGQLKQGKSQLLNSLLNMPVADAGDGHVQQRVEQLTLALLELSRDHHADLGITDTSPGPGK